MSEEVKPPLMRLVTETDFDNIFCILSDKLGEPISKLMLPQKRYDIMIEIREKEE